MNKIFAIGIKDLQLIFRDRVALVLMLAAPFAITLGLGFVSGAFSGDGGSNAISDIPVMILNEDDGDLGDQLVTLFGSDDLAELFAVAEPIPPNEARALVDADELAAVVVIPAGFSAGMLPDQSTGETAENAPIEIYRSPARPISVSVVETVVNSFLDQVDAGTALVTLTVDQLIESGETDPSVITDQVIRLLSDQDITSGSLISVAESSGSAADGEPEADFNVLSLLAPGMALFFLMYTVSVGGRSILQERNDGTMARMQTTATSGAQILGGKTFGIFLTGAAQVGILVIASSLLFDLVWGDWIGLIALILSAAIAATGWGLLFAAAAKTPEQIAGIGTAAMLLFGAISGTFIQIDNPLLNSFGAITPNQWALQGFNKLSFGKTLIDILPDIGALWLMAALLFVISAFLFRRNARSQ